jgi:hypothetical protein
MGPEKQPWTGRRFDRVVIKDSNAGPLWARFYELVERPIFVAAMASSNTMLRKSRLGEKRLSVVCQAPRASLRKTITLAEKWKDIPVEN